MGNLQVAAVRGRAPPAGGGPHIESVPWWVKGRSRGAATREDKPPEVPDRLRNGPGNQRRPLPRMRASGLHGLPVAAPRH